MSRLRPWEYIFSITNDGAYKRITILGIPIRIDITAKYKEICQNAQVQNNKILFMNYLGDPYGCNPKYIVNEIIKRNLPLDLVWIGQNMTDEFKKDFPPQVRFVEYKTKECIHEMSSAKIWVSNYHFVKLFSMGVTKKPEQNYIQTWHGSLGIKKIEKNVQHLVKDKHWTDFAIYNSRCVDTWVSNSTFETCVYKEGFWDVKNIQELGHPRNDIFFFSDEEKRKIKEKVYNELGISLDKKILIYVPTFRITQNLKPYKLDIDLVKEKVKKKFGGEWVVVSRMHPHFKRKNLAKLKFVGKVVEADNYPDIQELLVAADCAITDYSSCIFDFMLGRKPAFIFATDIEKYNNERGFYYPLEDTPFSIATTNYELAKNIENFDNEKYLNDIENFLKEKGCMEDGHASERVVDLIEEIMNKENKND